MADGMAIFAPNANSYRRVRPEAYVPMNATWGYNNRGVAVACRFRAPPTGASSIASRAPTPIRTSWPPSCSPECCTASSESSLPPPRSTAMPTRSGSSAPRLPGDWPTALTRFGASPFLREYFGERFVKLYELTRRGEMQDFNSRLTALDFTWYLESGMSLRPANSWYEATAQRGPAQPALEGDIEADVCVVGAGISGCSTAIHLAERGYQGRPARGRARRLRRIRPLRRPDHPGLGEQHGKARRPARPGRREAALGLQHRGHRAHARPDRAQPDRLRPRLGPPARRASSRASARSSSNGSASRKTTSVTASCASWSATKSPSGSRASAISRDFTTLAPATCIHCGTRSASARPRSRQA